jgi:hypothetical protein
MSTITGNVLTNHGSTEVSKEVEALVFGFLEKLGFSDISIDFDGDDCLGSVVGTFNKADISQMDVAAVSKSFGCENTVVIGDIVDLHNKLTQASFTVCDLESEFWEGSIDKNSHTFIESIDELILMMFCEDE